MGRWNGVRILLPDLVEKDSVASVGELLVGLEDTHYMKEVPVLDRLNSEVQAWAS